MPEVSLSDHNLPNTTILLCYLFIVLLFRSISLPDSEGTLGVIESWGDLCGVSDQDSEQTTVLCLLNWFARQTGLPVAYLESLICFGDRPEEPSARAPTSTFPL